MLKRAILTAAVMGLAATTVQAEGTHDAIDKDTRYLGVSGGNFMYDNEADASADLKGIALVGGYFVEDKWAVEVEAGTGFDDDTINMSNDAASTTTELDLEMDQYFSGYLVRHFATSEKSSIYVKGGMSHVAMTASPVDAAEDEDFSENGFSYGIGLQAHPTDKMGITLEYGQLVDTDAIQMDAVRLGLSSRF